MKKIYTILILLCSITVFAQAPQGFNYQATVRDSNGQLIINQNVYFIFNIIRNSPTALPIYSETHYAPTDDLGTVSLVIGQGTPTTGVFAEIPWHEGTYYLGIELNTGGGYIAMGTTQLLSVPYALYANRAGNTEPQNLASVLHQGNNGDNQQIKHIADPTDAKDAVTKSYVTLRVSLTGDTLWMGNSQWVIIPGISEANNNGGEPGTVTDIDGNTYTTVVIGNQVWMTQNLKVTHYRNGTAIDYPGENNDAWYNNNGGAYAWYNNNIEWKNIYGGLYNYFAVVNQNGLCPEGWHVPGVEEWNQLYMYIGQNTPSGNRLKSCRQVESPLEGCSTSTHPRWDYNATNHGVDDFHFSAIPAGSRGVEGGYSGMGVANELWTATEIGNGRAWARILLNESNELLNDDGYMKKGISVRCMKNQE